MERTIAMTYNRDTNETKAFIAGFGEDNVDASIHFDAGWKCEITYSDKVIDCQDYETFVNAPYTFQFLTWYK